MRKTIIEILLPVILATFLISPVVTKATYEVVVGEEYHYHVVKLEWDFHVESHSSSGQGFTIDGEHFGPGAEVHVEVNSVAIAEVNWTLSIGTATETRHSYIMDYATILRVYPSYGLLIIYELMEDWNQTAMDEGPGLFTLAPFLSADITTWEYMEDAVNPDTLGTITQLSGFEDFEVQGQYVETWGRVIIEAMIAGRADEPTGDEYFNLQNNFKCAYDKTTGVMKGMRIKASADGYLDDKHFDYTFEAHTELVGYNLPDFTFDDGDRVGGFVPGFEGFTVISGISSIVMIEILIRKFKK